MIWPNNFRSLGQKSKNNFAFFLFKWEQENLLTFNTFFKTAHSLIQTLKWYVSDLWMAPFSRFLLSWTNLPNFGNHQEIGMYSCNKITTTWIQISLQNWNRVNKPDNNCPIKVHRLFITLTRSLTNSMAQKTVKFLKNSQEDVFSFLFFKSKQRNAVQMASFASIFSMSSLTRANSP